jgi:serine/threonine protein kinase
VADERLIHNDSMFVVELRDPSGHEALAVKYPAATVPTSNVLARLEREYEIGFSLELPGVRKIIGRCEWKGRPALELEYVPGETFKTYFSDTKHRHLETVLSLALKAATALEFLHGQGVVHRDIAANNLLVR